MKPKKNIFPILILIITIVSGLFIYPLVFADDTCKYHENHDELCGYVESVSEQPCTHEHDENCYNEILVCTKEEHIHNEECIQEVKTLICDHTTEEEHTDDCYSTEEEFICTKEEHTHTDDCLKEELACTHEHDETCGYVKLTKREAEIVSYATNERNWEDKKSNPYSGSFYIDLEHPVEIEQSSDMNLQRD